MWTAVDGMRLYRQEVDSATLSYMEWAYAMEHAGEVAETIPPTLDEIADAAKRAQEAVIDQTAWELMYTGAEDAAEHSRMAFDYVGDKLQELGEDGANVWYGYLVATGQISSQAIEQFIKIELAYDSLRRMIASKKFTMDFIINVFTQQMGVATGATTTTAAPASTAYWIPDPSNLGHYMINPDRKAHGGYAASRYVITGDSPSGKPTGYEELVDFATRRVYSAAETRHMRLGGVPRLAGGSSKWDLLEGGIYGGQQPTASGSNWMSGLMAQSLGYNPPPGAIGMTTPIGGGQSIWDYGGSGGGSGAVIESAVAQAVSQAMSVAAAPAANSAASISAAAIEISSSAEKTTQATQAQTQQNNQGNAAIIARLQAIENLLAQNFQLMPKQWAAAQARSIPV